MDTTPAEQPTICVRARVHEAHGDCAGLDFDTWFERTQDARS
jgi:hypothetical protein